MVAVATLVFTLVLLTCLMRFGSMAQYIVESVRQRGVPSVQRIVGGATVLAGTALLYVAPIGCDDTRCTGPASVGARFLDRPPSNGRYLLDEFGLLLIGLGGAAMVDLFGRRREDGLLSGSDRLALFLETVQHGERDGHPCCARAREDNQNR